MIAVKLNLKRNGITMNETEKKNKVYGRTGQNWEQHARILFRLQEKRMTISGLAASIYEQISHVSACLWGIPGRRNPRIEAKVADFLGVDREELFGVGRQIKSKA
jgi:hypothetical protein